MAVIASQNRVTILKKMGLLTKAIKGSVQGSWKNTLRFFSATANPRVFFDVSIGDDKPKRIVMELRPDVAPKTSENFRQLCTGKQNTCFVCCLCVRNM